MQVWNHTHVSTIPKLEPVPKIPKHAAAVSVQCRQAMKPELQISKSSPVTPNTCTLRNKLMSSMLSGSERSTQMSAHSEPRHQASPAAPLPERMSAPI
eukprot:2995894-Amphidinium_carterae.2